MMMQAVYLTFNVDSYPRDEVMGIQKSQDLDGHKPSEHPNAGRVISLPPDLTHASHVVVLVVSINSRCS